IHTAAPLTTLAMMPTGAPFEAAIAVHSGPWMENCALPEMTAASATLGAPAVSFTASSLYDLNTVWAGLFTLMFVGFLLYYVIDFIERILLPWKISTTSQQLHV
ncbi:MAG TPA: hypothetical protein VFR21_28000, partial [Bradyrhizobium sp.]|nr:hypothetical protein [Bradyrhizobium sp.]